MKELPQNYDHLLSEKKWQEYWEREKTYAWKGPNAGSGKATLGKENIRKDNNFVIDTPPPTVSGLLHMGHIFSYTQADFVARFNRMIGKDVFYPMGFDDNGLPTERLVEKTINKKAGQMSREEFIIECEKVVQSAEEDFRKLFRSAALSVDWSQEYQTISAESRKLSQMSFLDLHNKSHVYRALQPMLWDPVDQTAIAQAEIVDKEINSFANYIPFGIVDANANPAEIKWAEIEKVTIMTTRPELLGACVALMCHPDDAAKYKGKKAVTPLFGVVVDIVADEKVDKEKGTGLVMCCTFGDETDIHWWKKHKLQTRIILNKYGKLEFGWRFKQGNTQSTVLGKNKILPDSEIVAFGMSAGQLDEIKMFTSKDINNFKEVCDILLNIETKKVTNSDPKNQGAREIILDLLKQQNLLSEQKPITHAVKTAERSGAPLEILPTHQWFVKVLDKKEQLKTKANECNWNPDFMRIRIEQWIDGLSWDWCISRQRYFGVPFPVWYSKRAGEEGKILLPKATQLPVNPLVDLPEGYTKDEVTPDVDVMDTWATSSISPQLSSKGISKELCLDASRHSQLFPADLRPQAHEIIRTWAFYTIVKAYLHEEKIPWENLMISGWCLAADKTKMSKSKGNVITPVALIEEKGTDAVRYWAATSKLGSDTAFSEDLLKIGKKLVNKIWNASKFVSLHLDKVKNPKTAVEDVKAGIINEPLDLWILSRLSKTVEKATKEFLRFEYSDARVAIEEFFWKDFCDNYLEMVKTRAYDEKGENPKGQLSAAHTIYYCLDAILKLFAPIVPHITEELYSHIFAGEFAKTKSIHAKGNWPVAANYPYNASAEAAGIYAVEALEIVRKAKSSKGVSIKWPVSKIEIAGEIEKTNFEKLLPDLKNVANAQNIEWVIDIAGGETSVDGKLKLLVTLAEQSDAA